MPPPPQPDFYDPGFGLGADPNWGAPWLYTSTIGFDAWAALGANIIGNLLAPPPPQTTIIQVPPPLYDPLGPPPTGLDPLGPPPFPDVNAPGFAPAIPTPNVIIVTVPVPVDAPPVPTGCQLAPVTERSTTVQVSTYTSTVITDNPAATVTVVLGQDGKPTTYNPAPQTVFQVYVYTTSQIAEFVKSLPTCAAGLPAGFDPNVYAPPVPFPIATPGPDPYGPAPAIDPLTGAPLPQDPLAPAPYDPLAPAPLDPLAPAPYDPLAPAPAIDPLTGNPLPVDPSLNGPAPYAAVFGADGQPFGNPDEPFAGPFGGEDSDDDKRKHVSVPVVAAPDTAAPTPVPVPEAFPAMNAPPAAPAAPSPDALNIDPFTGNPLPAAPAPAATPVPVAAGSEPAAYVPVFGASASASYVARPSYVAVPEAAAATPAPVVSAVADVVKPSAAVSATPASAVSSVMVVPVPLSSFVSMIAPKNGTFVRPAVSAARFKA